MLETKCSFLFGKVQFASRGSSERCAEAGQAQVCVREHK